MCVRHGSCCAFRVQIREKRFYVFTSKVGRGINVQYHLGNLGQTLSYALRNGRGFMGRIERPTCDTIEAIAFKSPILACEHVFAMLVRLSF